MIRVLLFVSVLLLPSIALAEVNGLNSSNDPSIPVRAAKGDRLIRVVSADRPSEGTRPKLLRQVGIVEGVFVNSK